MIINVYECNNSWFTPLNVYLRVIRGSALRDQLQESNGMNEMAREWNLLKQLYKYFPNSRLADSI